MAFAVNCPECGSALEVEDEHREWTVRCPDCRHEFRPDASAQPLAMLEDEEVDDSEFDERKPRQGSRRKGKTRSAATEIHGPAVALKCLGWLGLVASILSVGIWTLLVALVQNAPPGPRQPGAPNREEILAQAMMYIPQGCICFAISVAILIGAGRMSRLQSYGWAQTAAVLAMLPCVSPCCLLGLPFGLWALSVLNRPDVKTAFERDNDDDY